MPACAPIGKNAADGVGQYNVCRLEETVRLLMSTLIYNDRVESGEMTTTDAEKQLLAYRTLILGEIPAGRVPALSRKFFATNGLQDGVAAKVFEVKWRTRAKSSLVVLRAANGKTVRPKPSNASRGFRCRNGPDRKQPPVWPPPGTVSKRPPLPEATNVSSKAAQPSRKYLHPVTKSYQPVSTDDRHEHAVYGPVLRPVGIPCDLPVRGTVSSLSTLPK
jgi:hypothetical protein